DGRVEERELCDLWNPESRKWELPKGFEARAEGRDWTTKPFDELGLEAPRAFGSVEAVLLALDQRAIGLQDVIEMRGAGNGSRRVTTAGRVVFNHEVREALVNVVGEEELAEQPFPERHETLTKRVTGDVIEELVNLYGATAVSMVLDAFKSLGFRYASASGLTVSKNDIVVPPNKEEILTKYDRLVEEVEDYFAMGEMSAEERHDEVVRLWES